MKSLRTKILITILSVTILSNLAITQIAYTISSRELRKSGETDLKHVTDSVANEIYAANEQEFRMLNTLAVIPAIKDSSVPLAEKYKTIKSVIMTNNEYIDVTIIDKTGKAYASGANQMVDLSERAYFKEAKKGTEYVTDPFVNKVNGKLSIVYAAPVYDENRDIINVLIAVVNGQKLSTTVQRLVVGNNRNPVVVSRSTGNIIGDTTLNNVTDGKNIKSLVTESPSFAAVVSGVSSAETGLTYYKAGSRNMVVAYRPVPNAAWSIMSQVPVSDFEGGIRLMLQSMILAFVAASIVVVIICGIIIGKSVKPLKNVKDSIGKIATGNADLTQRIKITTKDEIGAVVSGFNSFAEKLQTIVTDIKNSKNTLATAGEDLHATTTDTATSITQIITNIETVTSQITNQASSVEQTAGAVNEISSNIASLDRMIESQSAGVTQASAAVEEMIGNISAVKQSVDKMVDSFKELENSARNGSDKQQDVNDRIEQIESQSNMLQDANTVIANIANQTNLLAMNAAIEAAHAGDAGKGFSVVSDEIRKLSETSSAQSKTIGEQLNKIKESIGGVVSASAESSTAFHSVSEKIQETDELVRQIRAAMEEQSEGSKQIGDALHSMNDSTTEVKTASDDMAAGNKAILEEVSRLQEASTAMKVSIQEMMSGTKKISGNGAALSEIADRIRDSIYRIGAEIDQFSV